MNSWRRVLVLCALCAWSPVTVADEFEAVSGWLQRMADAMRNQDYQGTFVYVRGDDVETIRLTHVHRDGTVRERLVAMSGPPREVIRDEEGVRAIIGEQNQPVEDPLMSGALFPEFSVAALSKARDRYFFELGGEDRIADFQALKLSITPRDRYRYGYELWLEPESGLLLRWVLYDPNRRSLAKLMFTDLVTGADVDRSELGEIPDRAELATLSAAAVPEDSSAWRKGREDNEGLENLRLPPGFMLAARARDPQNPDSEHLVFSDGLASVSVYLEPDKGDVAMPEGMTRMGTTSAWSRRQDDRRVTVVGEVPGATLKIIGQSFLRAAKAQ